MQKEHVGLIEAARAVQGTFSLSEHIKDFEAGGVGAAIRTDSGAIYTGICIDVACGLGFCAEHAAIAEMLKHRETRIVAAVAVGGDRILSPCGRCREFMAQVNPANMDCTVILAEDRTSTLKELLPEHWLFGE